MPLIKEVIYLSSVVVGRSGGRAEWRTWRYFADRWTIHLHRFISTSVARRSSPINLFGTGVEEIAVLQDGEMWHE